MADAGSVTSGSPMKPPRGQKLGRETGILMTVIKALLSSASASERDGIKTTVEQEYKTLDKNLDALILNKQESLNTVMQTFRHMCAEIHSAKERVAGVKSNLQKCKMLLHCRREELERLWLEGIEHKHALEILEQIDKVRNVPQQFNKAVARKQYLLASETLMATINDWNDDMEQIEGLRELKAELKIKRDKLYQILLEELNTEVFVKSAPSVGELKRQGSGIFSPFQRSTSDRHSSGRGRMNQIKARRIYLDTTSASSTLANPNALEENQDMDAFLSLVVKCVTDLKLLPRFKEDLKSQLDEKLLGAMNNISQQIIDISDATTGSSESKSHALPDFLQLTFSHFRLIVQHYLNLLALIENAEKTYNGNKSQTINMGKQDVWGHVQTVLQSTLKMYFDLGDSKRVPGASDFQNSSPAVFDINTYFAKKKPPKQKKLTLFKFAYSLHGLNHGGDSEGQLDKDRHRYLVCPANPRNIIQIYNLTQGFMQEIEEAFGGERCELRKFMSLNINRVFVQQVYKDISDAIEVSRRNADCWKDVISSEEAKQLNAPRPILQGVALFGRSLLDILSLAKDLPSHCDQLIRILDPILSSYRESCLEIYGNLGKLDEKKIISAAMVEDEDIERLLKSLPNWNKLQKRRDKRMDTVVETLEDVRSQNLREADLFVGLFGGKVVSQIDIVSDIRVLEQLSRFHESMEWISEIVNSVVLVLESQCSNEKALIEPISKVRSTAALFRELSSTCLLLLYLEVRVHAFYYLSPIAQKSDLAPGIDSQVPDPEALQLSKDLIEIETVLVASLQQVKSKYIFEGLGQLISTILIRAAADIRRINDNGVKRMCRNIFHLQQTLSSITKLPEVALDSARQFYEIFLNPIQELFHSLLEKGPQFREVEYMNAVQLLYRSKPGATREPLNDYLTRLSNILGDVGVTV